MDVKEFKQKYEELKDNPMYKNFCSILDTKSQVLERIAKENQELKKQHEIKETKQKEFIEWLEERIKATEDKITKYEELLMSEKETDVEYYTSIINKGVFDAFEEVLSKYKEIIGGSND